jgi:hypothetical protein
VEWEVVGICGLLWETHMLKGEVSPPSGFESVGVEHTPAVLSTRMRMRAKTWRGVL